MRLLVLLLAVGCDDRTSALIDIEGVAPLSSLEVTVGLPGRGVTRPLGALTPPRNLLILLPDVAQKVDVSLDGVEASGGRMVSAQVSFLSKPHQQVSVTMSLAGPGDDLSMRPDLAGADFAGYVEDLAGADLSPSGDLAGFDGGAVPSLSILAGLPGALNTYDAVGRDARFGVAGQPALVGTSLYLFELFSGRLRKVDVTTGAVTTVPLINASDSQEFRGANPAGLVADGLGHLYVACAGDHTIRKVNLADFKVSILAGTANTPGSTDSPPLFNEPGGLALDGSGDLWVADSNNFTIRKIALSGPTVTTPAGTPGANNFTDGDGAAGHFLHPNGLAFDSGNLYVTDGTGLRQVVVSASPAPVSTVIAEGTWNEAVGVASAGGGTLYMLDEPANNLRRVIVGPPASQTLVAGKNTFTNDSVDGIGPAARFTEPLWLVLDGAGSAYITESGAVRKVNLGNFDVTTLAGMSPQSDSTDSPRARFNEPGGMVFDGADSVYIADYGNNRIRKLALSTGNLTTFAGSGAYSSVDGQGLSASFYSPINVTRDNAGNLYVTDLQTHCVRKISPAADVVTIAGVAGDSGAPSPSPVPGLSEHFDNPNGLAFDGDHTLFLAASGNNRLCAIDLSVPEYTVTWIAGSGAGGSAPGIGRAASFNEPSGLAWDAAHKILYVSDNVTGLIRKVDMTNPAMPNVTNLVGSPFAQTMIDGAFADATFGSLEQIAFDGARNILWVADGGFDTVRRVDLTAQLVTTPIGVANGLLTKPGPLPAFIARPTGIALTPKGIVLSSFDEHTVLLATGL